MGSTSLSHSHYLSLSHLLYYKRIQTQSLNHSPSKHTLWTSLTLFASQSLLYFLNTDHMVNLSNVSRLSRSKYGSFFVYKAFQTCDPISRQKLVIALMRKGNGVEAFGIHWWREAPCVATRPPSLPLFVKLHMESPPMAHWFCSPLSTLPKTLLSLNISLFLFLS